MDQVKVTVMWDTWFLRWYWTAKRGKDKEWGWADSEEEAQEQAEQAFEETP